jgi:voltage-gated potassium channel
MTVTVARPASGAALLTVPRRPFRPVTAILGRLTLAAVLLVTMALVVWLGREGYSDDTGRPITFLSALYYASVSITTTGYGDIAPVTDLARGLTVVVVLPLRVLFLIVLVGTTLEILTEQSREALRRSRWRARMRDHYIVCGYGVKGRAAVATLLARGIDQRGIVVIDTDGDALAEANLEGLAAVHGNAARTAVLVEARVGDARGVIVAPDADDTAVLITLTARELNRSATIVASVRESENAHLLIQSGADSVITSSEASGRLMGLATTNPRVVAVLEDLLKVGEGLDVIERDPRPHELGASPRSEAGELPVALIRGSATYTFSQPEFYGVQPGDRIVCLCGPPPGG